MRAGTQTLIQALQAIPWTDDPDNDDELLNHALGSAIDSDSEEEDGPGKQTVLSSPSGMLTQRKRVWLRQYIRYIDLWPVRAVLTAHLHRAPDSNHTLTK